MANPFLFQYQQFVEPLLPPTTVALDWLVQSPVPTLRQVRIHADGSVAPPQVADAPEFQPPSVTLGQLVRVRALRQDLLVQPFQDALVPAFPVFVTQVLSPRPRVFLQTASGTFFVPILPSTGGIDDMIHLGTKESLSVGGHMVLGGPTGW